MQAQCLLNVRLRRQYKGETNQADTFVSTSAIPHGRCLEQDERLTAVQAALILLRKAALLRAIMVFMPE